MANSIQAERIEEEEEVEVHEKEEEKQQQQQVNEVKSENEKRIFVNHVDSFHGKYIARYLARVKPGSTNVSKAEEETTTEHNQPESEDEHVYLDGWKIIGTVKDNQKYIQPPFIQEIIQNTDRNQLIDYLKHVNVIIYDITQDPRQVDEAIWVCEKLESLIPELDHQITFILLSTIMTWVKTSTNEEAVPFAEDDFRRRRPHPNYKEHYNAEKIVTKLGLTNKTKLFTYIVATGLTYGMGENVFHYLFKGAWHNVPELEVYGKGNNFLPTIHVLDLAALLQHLADRQFKTRYIAATDSSNDTLVRITRKVSQALAYGRIETVEPEEAMLNKDITQNDFEMIMVNMQFVPIFIKEQIHIKWHCEHGLCDNVDFVAEEYRIERNLTPIKICILGPPASGKTIIAKQLAQAYKLHHLQIKDVLEETRDEMERLVKRSSDDDDINQQDYDEISGERIDEARSLLEKLEDIRRNSKYVRLDDDTLTQIFKMKLMSPPCQNQGYILDGYPKTFDQAQSLFAASDEKAEDETEDKKSPINELIIPEFIFILDANDAYLRQRVLYLSEKEVAGTHNTELGFKRRLKIYNDLGDDSHPAKFFEDFDRFCETIKIDDDRSPNHRSIVEKIMERIKSPHNYGLTPEEEEIVKARELFEKEKREREEREEREREEQEAYNERIKKHKEWNTKLDQIKDQEKQILDTQSLPLRNYLMIHVMPTLTKALIECCQVQPEDPVDFVAEYLFKNNPQM